MKTINLILLLTSLSFSLAAQAAFYDDPANSNNKKCVEFTSKTADAMKMQEMLKEAIVDTKAKPTPAILKTYYDIYDDMEKGSKGILDSCKLNKAEREKFFNIGVHAAQMKASVKFTLNE